MAFKTDAIVLHSRELANADRLYDVLTPHDGRLTVFAKSAAKSNSKMAGHLVPFAHVQLMLGRGHRDHVAGAATVDSYRELRESWPHFILASSLVELILRFNVPGLAAQEEFKLLKSAFDLLRSEGIAQRDKVLVARIFLWKLIALAGWKPNLDQCASCRQLLSNGQVYYISPKGFVCSRHGSNGTMLHSALLPFLKKVLDKEMPSLLLEPVESEVGHDWFELSQRYYQDVIGHQLQSLKFFPYLA